MGMDQYLLIPFLVGMNIHLPAILMFTRVQGFDTLPNAAPKPWFVRHGFKNVFFPTCQVRVVRFYVSCFLLVLVLLLLLPLLVLLLLLLLSSLLLSSPRLLSSSPLLLLPAGPQPRPSPPSVPCRTSTASIPAQCSLPDLNHDHPRPVFPAGPQPRPSPPSVPCRTSTTTIHAQCSLPDLNRMSEDMPDRMSEDMPDKMP